MIFRIHTKLSLLVGFVICTFLVGMVVLYRHESVKVHEIMERRSQEKAALVRELTDLYSAPSKTLAYDYSFWDETVDFVANPDSVWARENIDVGLGTFNSSAAWVFDTAERLVYFTADSLYLPLRHDPVLRARLVAAFSHEWFNHFYYSSPLGVMEIYTAPVQPSADSKRETDPKGFFVVGRVIDEEYTKRIEAIAEVTTHLTQSIGKHLDGPTGVITVHQPLLGHDGDTVAVLCCTAQDPLYASFARSSRVSIIVLLVSGCTLLALLFVSLFIWLSRPLRSISSALEQGNVELVTSLTKTRTEFGQVARLIRDFFEQKSELERQIEAQGRARKALLDSENRYRVVAEQTGQLVYDWDVRSGNILWAGAIEALTQYSTEEYRKVDIHGWEHMIHPDDRHEVIAVLDRVAKTGSGFVAEYRLQRRDGTYIIVEDNGVFIRDDRGEPVQMLGTMRDITERKQAEARHRSLQDKLDRAQRMESLAVLAGGVAHDLNNMLGPVVGYSELLLKTIPPDSKSASQLKRIMKAARDAADVIGDLLTLARRGRYEKKPLNLNEVVGSFLESTGMSKLQERHPRVTIELKLDDLVGMIEGSRPHLEKVLMNLVANGCEAMLDGGTLSITTESRYLEELLGGPNRIEPGHYALLRVKDTGRGIDSRDLPRIFEPYFSKKQLGQSGSGLGLSVVYGVVKDHGGYYDVFSELGKGTEFILYFPSCGAVNDTAVESHHDVLGGTESILVVDDSQDQRDMAFDLMSSLGYRVHTCATGREAARHLDLHSVDLMVIDMIMEPDFDGLATYREALRIRPGQKAIIVTGYSTSDNVLETQRLGAGACLRKPYTLEEIAKAIRETLGAVRVSGPRPSASKVG